MLDLNKYKKDDWDSDQDFYDLVYEELRKAGKPLDFDEICQRLNESYGIRQNEDLYVNLMYTLAQQLTKKLRVRVSMRPPEYLERLYEAV